MERLLLFLGSFIGIYVLYLITVVIQTKKMDKFKSGKQVQYFVRKYGLKFKNISVIKFVNLLSLTNSLIMAITITVISFIPNLVVKLMVAFVLLFPLIQIGYSMLGKYIVMKEGK